MEGNFIKMLSIWFAMWSIFFPIHLLWNFIIYFSFDIFAFYGHVPFDTYLIVKKCKMLGNFDKVLNCKPNTVPDWQFCIFRELLSVKWHDIMTVSQDDGNFICVDIRFRLYIYAHKKISDFAIFDANRLWLSIFVSWNRNHVIT